MATFESKFGLGDNVYLASDASYHKTPTIYSVYSVTFIGDNTAYGIIRVGDRHDFVEMVYNESLLVLVQE